MFTRRHRKTRAAEDQTCDLETTAGMLNAKMLKKKNAFQMREHAHVHVRLSGL